MSIQSHREKWRQHKAATLQAVHQPPAVLSRRADSPDIPLMLASLENDEQRLHNINSLSSKQEVKRAELLPRYRAYLIKHMADGKKPGPVLVRNMIWSFDTDDLAFGMQCAAYIMQQGGAVMPEGFKRDFPNYILGTVGDLAVQQMKDSQPVTDYILTVYAWLHDHPEWDVVDKIRAAVLKGMGGYQEQNSGNPITILELYEKAQELDPLVNLRRKITSLKAELSTNAEPEPEEPAA